MRRNRVNTNRKKVTFKQKLSRKSTRKNTRKSTRKISRKNTRKSTRKISRKNTRKSTRKISRKNTQKKIESIRKSTKIIDVPFSKKKHLGTLASSDEINYNYQNMSNMVRFLEILKTKREIKDVSLWPNVHVPGNISGKKFGDNYSLLKVDLDSAKTKITPWFLTQAQYKKEFKLKKARFVPILIISIGKLIVNHSRHANILLVDNDREVIEFFEPHGYKKDFSTPSDPVTQYHKKHKALEAFWKKITPKYEFINASDILGKRNFQTKYDRGTGYCTVWSTLFAHYRLLNQDTPLEDLMNHIDKKIKVTNLLKYARYIEDTVKKKI